jgi:chorismate mutase
MPFAPADLQTLRRCLDEIDDRLQDLLIDRAEIVSLVGESKKEGDQPAFQPAREAEIIRRLVRRHHGSFPVANLSACNPLSRSRCLRPPVDRAYGIWRAIIMAAALR